MATLNESQLRDLRRLKQRYVATAGTFDYGERGAAIPLRCSRSLAKLGLVELGNGSSANRQKRWWITKSGLATLEAHGG